MVFPETIKYRNSVLLTEASSKTIIGIFSDLISQWLSRGKTAHELGKIQAEVIAERSAFAGCDPVG